MLRVSFYILFFVLLTPIGKVYSSEGDHDSSRHPVVKGIPQWSSISRSARSPFLTVPANANRETVRWILNHGKERMYEMLELLSLEESLPYSQFNQKHFHHYLFHKRKDNHLDDDSARDNLFSQTKPIETGTVPIEVQDELLLAASLAQLRQQSTVFGVPIAGKPKPQTSVLFDLGRIDTPEGKIKWDSFCGCILKHSDKYKFLDLSRDLSSKDTQVERKDRVELSLFERVRDLLHLSVDVVLFDTTTIVYYGEGEKGEELLKRGFSKARRGDLKQIVIGVIMSKEGYPLGHEVFSGNTNDRSCFKEIIDKISDRFRLGKVILVRDRGMISQKNIDHLESNGYEYILGYRMRTIPKNAKSTPLIIRKQNPTTPHSLKTTL